MTAINDWPKCISTIKANFGSHDLMSKTPTPDNPYKNRSSEAAENLDNSENF